MSNRALKCILLGVIFLTGCAEAEAAEPEQSEQVIEKRIKKV